MITFEDQDLFMCSICGELTINSDNLCNSCLDEVVTYNLRYFGVSK